MAPKVVSFRIAQGHGSQGQFLGTGDEDPERLRDLIGRLEAVVPHLERLEKLADQLGWEISGIIWAKGE